MSNEKSNLNMKNELVKSRSGLTNKDTDSTSSSPVIKLNRLQKFIVSLKRRHKSAGDVDYQVERPDVKPIEQEKRREEEMVPLEEFKAEKADDNDNNNDNEWINVSDSKDDENDDVFEEQPIKSDPVRLFSLSYEFDPTLPTKKEIKSERSADSAGDEEMSEERNKVARKILALAKKMKKMFWTPLVSLLLLIKFFSLLVLIVVLSIPCEKKLVINYNERLSNSSQLDTRGKPARSLKNNAINRKKRSRIGKIRRY